MDLLVSDELSIGKRVNYKYKFFTDFEEATYNKLGNARDTILLLVGIKEKCIYD